MGKSHRGGWLIYPLHKGLKENADFVMVQAWRAEEAIDSLIENEESKEKYLVEKEEAASSYTYKKPKTGH